MPLPNVCQICGVPVGQARPGRWIHVDDLPEGAQEHEALPVDRVEFQVLHAAKAQEGPLIYAKVWAKRMEERVALPEFEGVAFSDEVRWGIVLFQALEVAEVKIKRLGEDLEILSHGSSRGE